MPYLKLDKGMCFNGVSMFTINVKEYKQAKEIEKAHRQFKLIKVFPTLWSALLAVSLPVILGAFT